MNKKKVDEKASCYFCKETLDEKCLLNHVEHCGAVLEECPNKCGAYVPRRELQEHQVQGCPKMSDPEGNMKAMKEATWKSKVVSILSLLRAAITEGEKETTELRETLVSSLQLTNSALRQDILEELFESRRINNSFANRLTQMEKLSNDMEQRTQVLFQRNITHLENLQLDGEQQQNQIDKCYEELTDLKCNFTKESALVSKLWQEQVRNVHDMRLELEMRCKITKELEKKYAIVSDKMDLLVEIINKQQETISEQESGAQSLRMQMKQNIDYIEDLLETVDKKIQSQNCNCHLTHLESPSTNGRLMWRIESVEKKLSASKFGSFLIFSPIFYDKEYGYTLRMQLMISDSGKWKDHVIGSLTVIEGKWDALLEWPCTLMADIILKDQSKSGTDMKRLVKIVNKSETSGFDHYMIIPHSTFTQHTTYIKNDVMFIDIRVREIKVVNSSPTLYF